MRSFSLKDLKNAYEQFNEEQKIAFILAGGAPQLFAFWQQTRESQQKARERACPSGPLTGALPIVIR